MHRPRSLTAGWCWWRCRKGWACHPRGLGCMGQLEGSQGMPAASLAWDQPRSGPTVQHYSTVSLGGLEGTLPDWPLPKGGGGAGGISVWGKC